MDTVAMALGVLVSITLLIGAAWAALWAVNGKILKFRDWLRDEIKTTVADNTETLRPNGGRSVGDLPDLVHRMRRENEEQHAHLGDRLTVVEERTKHMETRQGEGMFRRAEHAAKNLMSKGDHNDRA